MIMIHRNKTNDMGQGITRLNFRCINNEIEETSSKKSIHLLAGMIMVKLRNNSNIKLSKLSERK